jgi:hypothetical protein
VRFLWSSCLMLVVFLASCDRCKNTICENGECERGFCKCPEAYVGDACEIQNRPETITLTRVEFTDLPEEIFINRKWDSDTSTANAFRPDVMLQIKLGNNTDEIFNSVERYPDAELTEFAFGEQMRVKISDGFPALNFHLADLDSDGPEFMYNVQVLGYYTPTNGFPSEVSGQNEDGAKSTLYLEYQY